VRRSVAGTSITLATEKGKDTYDTARSLTLPRGAIPGLDELLVRWEAVRGPVGAGTSYYWLPSDVLSRGSKSAHVFPPSQIDAWCREILEHLSFSPPSGESWSGHSLRKGAASGAAAIDVALRKICFMGGWSILSRAVHDYIDPTCPASDACRRFFGWLRSS